MGLHEEHGTVRVDAACKKQSTHLQHPLPQRLGVPGQGQRVQVDDAEEGVV